MLLQDKLRWKVGKRRGIRTTLKGAIQILMDPVQVLSQATFPMAVASATKMLSSLALMRLNGR